jgi:hypothetical protein
MSLLCSLYASAQAQLAKGSELESEYRHELQVNMLYCGLDVSHRLCLQTARNQVTAARAEAEAADKRVREAEAATQGMSIDSLKYHLFIN